MVRWISAGLAASVASLGYSFGHLAGRTTLLYDGSRLGLDYDNLSISTSAIAIVGTLSVGWIALLIGPSATAALGLATCAVGNALLMSPGTFFAGALLGAFGAGMVHPSLYAMAARPFPAGSVWVPAILVFAYVGSNSGAMVGTIRWGSSSVFAIQFVGVPALAAVVCGIDAAIQRYAPPTEPERVPVTPGTGRPVVAAIAAAMALGCIHPMWSLAMSYQGTILGATTARQVGVSVAGFSLALILSIVALTGRRVPLLLGGIGFVGVGASALAVIQLGEMPVDSLLLIVLVLVGGIPEVIAFPIVIAATVRGVPWRLSTAIASLPVAAAGLFNLLAANATIGTWASLVGAGATLVIGVGMAAIALPFERWAREAPAS